MINILIVDDEKSICDLIDINLSAAGYHCKTVQDGLEALDMIESENFDLILLDIMLPGADGYDIMEYIRPLRIPVIFITAKHEVRDRVKSSASIISIASSPSCTVLQWYPAADRLMSIRSQMDFSSSTISILIIPLLATPNIL